MDPEALRRDRRLYHIHTATALIGFLGILGIFPLERMIVASVIPWLFVGFSLPIVASGVLAIKIKRTFITGLTELDPDVDPHDVGDALTTPGMQTLDFAPAKDRAAGPYAILFFGLIVLVLSTYAAIAGPPWS